MVIIQSVFKSILICQDFYEEIVQFFWNYNPLLGQDYGCWQTVYVTFQLLTSEKDIKKTKDRMATEIIDGEIQTEVALFDELLPC
ncbi:hypothetical protein KHA80_22400 [Anaerobacillus sp. HL2]|nr:hypothetical protein KHA80_22400 [Anaerobacillus sp. HL2]